MSDWADAAPDGELYACVWDCGDDWCNCSEAQILHIVERNEWGGWRKAVELWSGKFRTDGESGATSDLNREARRLRRDHNALFHRISWPWDRS